MGIEVPDQIGRYEVIQHPLRERGHGGSFLCRQTGPMGFEKVAALRSPKPSLGGQRVLRCSRMENRVRRC